MKASSNDGEIVAISPRGCRASWIAIGAPLEREDDRGGLGERSRKPSEKGGYDTFMLKEIHEQPDAVAETIA